MQCQGRTKAYQLFGCPEPIHLPARRAGMPLYKLLKKTDAFIWTKEAQQALESLKASLMSAPILVAPEWGEPLLLYVAASNHVVSAALVIEREELGHQLNVQQPVYFIGEVLTDPKVQYPQVQKLIYAVLMVTRKLLHYFTDHKVTVVTSYPLGDIIHNRDAMGRISKWALELMGHDIRYTPAPQLSLRLSRIFSPNGQRSSY